MVGHDLAVLADDDAVRISVDLDRPPRRLRAPSICC